jgi:hypothetical protein
MLPASTVLFVSRAPLLTVLSGVLVRHDKVDGGERKQQKFFHGHKSPH